MRHLFTLVFLMILPLFSQAQNGIIEAKGYAVADSISATQEIVEEGFQKLVKTEKD